MTEENSTPEEKELNDLFNKEEQEKNSTSQKEEDSEKEKSENLSDEAFLKKVNEIEGRNYKSIDDYQKTVKERNKEFSEEGQKKKEDKSTQKPEANEDLIEMFYETKPKAQLVRDDIKEIAKAKGISEIQVWKNEAWLHKKADELAEDEENKGKVGDPSQNVKGNDGDKEQKEFTEFYKQNLPPGFEA